MNNLQKKLVLGGIVAVVVMVLYPPWVVTTYQKIEKPLGYGLLISPPRGAGSVKLDMARLFIQFIGVGVVVFGGIWYLKDENQKK